MLEFPLWLSGNICFAFLGLHLQHVEVPRLGVDLELQLPGYTTATATLDLSHICKLHHGSWQYQIPDTLSEARNGSPILWILIRLLWPEPQRELQEYIFKGRIYKAVVAILTFQPPEIIHFLATLGFI